MTRGIAALTALDNDIDPERHRIRYGEDGWARLRPQAWLAFALLYGRRGHVVRAGEIACAVWPAQAPVSEHAMRQLICELRRQLRPTPFTVTTWDRIGYEIEIADETAGD